MTRTPRKASKATLHTSDWARGARAAAEIAAQFDDLSWNEYRVSECILAKLNLLSRKPRRNPGEQRTRASLETLRRAMARALRTQPGDLPGHDACVLAVCAELLELRQLCANATRYIEVHNQGSRDIHDRLRAAGKPF